MRQNQLIPLNADGSPLELSPSSAGGKVSSGGTTPRSGTTTPKSGSITPRQASSSSIKRETSSSSIKGAAPNTPRRGGRGIPQPTAASSSGPPRSRLPMPGTGPTQGRSPSFTNLKPQKDRSSIGSTGSGNTGSGGNTTSKQSGMQRERSFVEPNFVETFKPPQVQIMSSSASPSTALMGSPGHAAQKMSERLEEKVAVLQVRNKVFNLAA